MFIHNKDIIVEMAAHLDTPAVIHATLYFFCAFFLCLFASSGGGWCDDRHPVVLINCLVVVGLFCRSAFCMLALRDAAAKQLI